MDKQLRDGIIIISLLLSVIVSLVIGNVTLFLIILLIFVITTKVLSMTDDKQDK